MTRTEDRRHIVAIAETLVGDFERHPIEKSRAPAQHPRHRAHGRLTLTPDLPTIGGPLKPSLRRFNARRPGGTRSDGKSNSAVYRIH